jgi:hypothetical protein
MTIAATLARKLHETLGEEAADAMVDWMHRVDTGRSELRELNEWNFERFEAKLDARAGELHGRIDTAVAELNGKVETCRVELSGKIDTRIEGVRREMQTGFARLETAIERQKVDLTRWAIGFWLISLVALVGTLAALARLPR